MGPERWGSLSVTDHVDTESLVANVLLYDRLVFPVFTEAEDRDERAYWLEHGWDPDLQAQRLEQLGDLAVHKPWNARLRKQFRRKFAELQAIQGDADNLDALHVTREILAQKQELVVPAGQPKPEVIAAYSSLDGLRTDFICDQAREAKALQACLVARELAIPDIRDPEAALDLAIDLSRDGDFRERRAALFDWQDTLDWNRYTPEQAVEYMSELTRQYNQAVNDAHKKVYYRFAFVIGGAVLGLLGAGLGQPVAGASAILALIQFGTLDKHPVIEAGKARPMAAFHDLKTRLGLEFRKG